ncbi:alkaline phosphatase family protein [Brachybacterium sp. EF45031]|uniref:alkaline phosphatase family protein n=1 Tax=Brachybacterium sillae TaxID=2810536 RepID=UPI00217D9634|nr:alkaline phosphatase family protein [Brachybacterium sillae]MCS6710510.1 alkaline phosphatase family protein [Brachybacterium sillae]
MTRPVTHPEPVPHPALDPATDDLDLLLPPSPPGDRAEDPRALWSATTRPGVADLLTPLLPPRDVAAAAGEPSVTGRDVVVLVDGLGARLLQEHRSLTPTLRRLTDESTAVTTTAPATTASAMATLLTGRSPLEHGVLGYTGLHPHEDRAVSQLTGADDVDPDTWIPVSGLAERSARRAVHVGPRRHDGSHFTRAAYRGWDIVTHRRPDQVLDAVRTAVRHAGDDGLLLVHLTEVDHAGHGHGVASRQWREALEGADSTLAALLRVLPTGTRVTITADHGMVDARDDQRVDLATWPELDGRLRAVAGDPRALGLRLQHPQEAAAIGARIEERTQGLLRAVPRPQLLRMGLYGPSGTSMTPELTARVPDLLLLGTRHATVAHSRLAPRTAPPEIGVHGAPTARELAIPLVRTVV